MADWEERFGEYVERLGDVLGHADRRAPLRAGFTHENARVDQLAVR
jgi:SRSO17 transposase